MHFIFMIFSQIHTLASPNEITCNFCFHVGLFRPRYRFAAVLQQLVCLPVTVLTPQCLLDETLNQDPISVTLFLVGFITNLPSFFI